ncbi:MAG: type II toxin-antitoxin system HicA family toxin [Betaproteobacteria bacterium]|nr:type II toxin-antitoxin system HicA family toxin [Betaproteobacteria bacterium]
MKRTDLLRHLQQHGCVLLREGGKHSVFVNRATRKTSTVPRHREINDFLARKICRDLEVPNP